jgi:rhomboid-like protein
MSWLASSRSYFLLLNSTRRQLSFSFRPRLPRDLSVSQHLRNVRLQSGAVPSFREQVARINPVPCFADAVKHPEIGKHIIVC